jgi:hypothetical protein
MNEYRLAFRHRIGLEQQRQACIRVAIGVNAAEHADIADPAIAKQIDQEPGDIARLVRGKQRTAESLCLPRVERAR